MSEQVAGIANTDEGAWSSIRACFWPILAALGAGFLVGFIDGFVGGFISGFMRSAGGLHTYDSYIKGLPLIIFSVLATSLVFLLFDRKVLRSRMKQVLSDWTLHASSGLSFLFLAICVLLGLLVTSAWGLSASLATRALYANASSLVWIGLAGSICLLGPLAEEFYFRGFVWDRLSATMSPRRVGIVSALLFLSMHFVNGLLAPLFLIPLATVLTMIRIRGLGLGVCVLAHALYNGTIILGYFLQTHAGMFGVAA